MATAQGASAANAVMVASTMSNRTIEDINAATRHPVWFQLYVEQDRAETIAMIQRAVAAGCQALCITVDQPVTYARNRVARVDDQSPTLPLPNLHLAAAPGIRPGRGTRSRAFNWKDLLWIRAAVPGIPIILKGIVNPTDADIAAKEGADGIIVSNHGGRSLDSVVATIDALPRVADRVAGRIPVLMDGGIRRGTDVLKALALGARAVLVDRPYLYGLTVGGADGVKQVVDILRTELEIVMALTGCTSIDQIDSSVLWK